MRFNGLIAARPPYHTLSTLCVRFEMDSEGCCSATTVAMEAVKDRGRSRGGPSVVGGAGCFGGSFGPAALFLLAIASYDKSDDAAQFP